MFKCHYPDENSPIYSYTLEQCPLLDGLTDSLNLGVNLQRTADGELQGSVTHDVRDRYVRSLAGVSTAKKAERDAFFSNTRGLPFRFTDDTLGGTYVTVKAIGQSLEGEQGWSPSGRGGLWGRTEEFEETTEMPDIDDLGNFRLGTATFTEMEVQKKVTFDGGAFTDAVYRVHSCVAFIASTGEKIDANPVLPLEDDGITVRLSAPPGMAGSGETVRVDVSAVRP